MSGALAFSLEIWLRASNEVSWISLLPSQVVGILGLSDGPVYMLCGSSCGAYSLLGAEISVLAWEVVLTTRHLRANGGNRSKQRLIRLGLVLGMRVANVLGQCAAMWYGAGDSIAYSGHIGGLAFGGVAMTLFTSFRLLN